MTASENDLKEAHEKHSGERQSEIEAIKVKYQEEIEALKTGIQEELGKQKSDLSVTQQESESKHAADKTEMREKITELELKLMEQEISMTQKEKTIALIE